MTADKNIPPEQDPRVTLAAERTLLAWVRTSLAMMALGFVVARFGLFLNQFEGGSEPTDQTSSALSLWIGGALIILGVIVNVAAVADHLGLLRRLRRGESYRPRVWSLSVVVTLLLAVFGIAMTAYLIFWIND